MNFANPTARRKFKRGLRGVRSVPGAAGLAAFVIAQATEDYLSGDETAAAWFAASDWYKFLLTALGLPPDYLPAPVAADVGRR